MHDIRLLSAPQNIQLSSPDWKWRLRFATLVSAICCDCWCNSENSTINTFSLWGKDTLSACLSEQQNPWWRRRKKKAANDKDIYSVAFFPPLLFFTLTLKRRMTFFQINQHLLAGRTVGKARETENRSERERVKVRERGACVKECASLLAVSLELRHLRVSVGLLRMKPLMFHGMFNSGDDWR